MSPVANPEFFKIRLHVLSPLHIGCGEVYEPTGFVIDEQRRSLLAFDPLDFVNALSDADRKRFSEICMSDRLLELYKFIRDKFSSKVPVRMVDVVSGLVSSYKRVMALQAYDPRVVINNFTLSRTSFNPQTNLPFIPGTSLKGALRTSVLSNFAAVARIVDFRERANVLEGKLLDGGSFNTDPFRLLKVGDLLPAGPVKTRIVYAINRKRAPTNRPPRESTGPQQIFEVIQPGAVFEGRMTFTRGLGETIVRKPFGPETLFRALNDFYIGKLENEVRMLKGIGVQSYVVGKINENKAFEGRVSKEVFVVRLGRHSGAEAVTIDGNRRIRIMQGPGRPARFEPAATTVWLAAEEPRPATNNGLMPFGWAALEVVR